MQLIRFNQNGDMVIMQQEFNQHNDAGANSKAVAGTYDQVNNSPQVHLDITTLLLLLLCGNNIVPLDITALLS